MERLHGMQLTGRVTPAVIAYEGIQYQSMAPAVMEDKHFDYLREHQVTDVEQMKAFSEMGYRYQEQLSDHETLVFILRV